MEKKFLDATGLAHLWAKIKETFMIKPETGTKDQVLTLNEDGTYSWKDAQGGSCDCQALTDDEIDAAIEEA